jgi:hypothetical protein
MTLQVVAYIFTTLIPLQANGFGVNRLLKQLENTILQSDIRAVIPSEVEESN